jgi:hypothetical protein
MGVAGSQFYYNNAHAEWQGPRCYLRSVLV